MSDDATIANVDVVQAIWLLSQRLNVTVEDAAAIYLKVLTAFKGAMDASKRAN